MKTLYIAALAAAAATISAPGSAATTILDFDRANSCTASPCTPGAAIRADYGSIPAVLAISYLNNSSGGTLNFLQSGQISGETNAYAYASGPVNVIDTFEISFDVADGYSFEFLGIDVREILAGADPYNAVFELIGDDGVTSVSSTFAVDGSVDLQPTGLAMAPYEGSVTLRVTAKSGLGIDNLAFDIRQTAVPGAVPEPASWAMIIAGFGLVGSAMRRRTAEGTTDRTRFA